MAEPSGAYYDFAFLSSGTLDFVALGKALEALRRDFDEAQLPVVELYGRPDAGEVVVLLRFSLATYSAALRRRMDSEGNRLKARVADLQLASFDERERFYGQKLKACEVRVDATRDATRAVEAFRERMGLSSGGAGVLRVRFDSRDALLAAWARHVAEGALLIPSAMVPPKGEAVTLLLCAPHLTPIEAKAVVTAVSESPAGFFAAIEPAPELMALSVEEGHRRRSGRLVAVADGRRRDERFESWLEVKFTSPAALADEFATNISKGGLFVRSDRPLPLRSRVGLRLLLPDGRSVETAAEVVHSVSAAEAKARDTVAGAGLAFRASDAAFLDAIAGLIEQFRSRAPRVLVADRDPAYAKILAETLIEEGMQVETASDGREAMRRITDRLFELDLLLLDVGVPGLDGYSVLRRIRTLGGELDLRVLVVSDDPPKLLAELEGPDGANLALPRRTKLSELVAALRKLLGR